MNYNIELSKKRLQLLDEISNLEQVKMEIYRKIYAVKIKLRIAHASFDRLGHALNILDKGGLSESEKQEFCDLMLGNFYDARFERKMAEIRVKLYPIVPAGFYERGGSAWDLPDGNYQVGG